MPQLPLFQEAPTSLCVLRLSAIGDCCNAVAAVQAIQHQWPSTAITWIMGKTEAGLLGDLVGVEVIPFDKHAGVGGMAQVWRQLRGRRFDALLHMQSALRASVLSFRIRARARLGFDGQRAKDGQHLFTNQKVPSPTSPHVLDGFMAFAHALGVSQPTPRWDIRIAEQEQAWAQEALGTGPTLLLAPAASLAYKNWTPEGYAAIADHASDWGFQVAVCSSPAASERQVAAQVIERCAERPLDLAGKTSLKELFALIRQANLVLGPDSGPLHMATAAGTAALGLYAHHDPARTGPYFCREYAVSAYHELVREEHGKPPEELPWRTRVKSPDAMTRIKLEDVRAAFDRIVRDRGLA